MKLLTYLGSVLLLAGVIHVNAQHHQMDHKMQKKKTRDMQQSMTAPGPMMHHSMMSMRGSGCPVCGNMVIENSSMDGYASLVNMLPNTSDSLSLSNSQLENFIDMRAEYKKQQVDHMAELSKQQMKLKNLLEEDASEEQVRQQLKACSDVRLEMKMLAYKTAREMKNELNSEQKEKLKKMMHMHFGMMRDREMIYNDILREFLQ